MLAPIHHAWRLGHCNSPCEGSRSAPRKEQTGEGHGVYTSAAYSVGLHKANYRILAAAVCYCIREPWSAVQLLVCAPSRQRARSSFTWRCAKNARGVCGFLLATLGKNRAGYIRADKGARLNAYLAALAALAHPLTHLQTSPHTSPHTFFQHLAATTVS